MEDLGVKTSRERPEQLLLNRHRTKWTLDRLCSQSAAMTTLKYKWQWITPIILESSLAETDSTLCNQLNSKRGRPVSKEADREINSWRIKRSISRGEAIPTESMELLPQETFQIANLTSIQRPMAKHFLTITTVLKMNSDRTPSKDLVIIITRTYPGIQMCSVNKLCRQVDLKEQKTSHLIRTITHLFIKIVDWLLYRYRQQNKLINWMVLS